MPYPTVRTRLGTGSTRLTTLGWFAVIYAVVHVVADSFALLLNSGTSMIQGWRPLVVFFILALVVDGVLLASGIGVLARREWARRATRALFLAVAGKFTADALCRLVGRDLDVVVQSMGQLLARPRLPRASAFIGIALDALWVGIFLWGFFDLASADIVVEFSSRRPRGTRSADALGGALTPDSDEPRTYAALRRTRTRAWRTLAGMIAVFAGAAFVLGLALASIYWNGKYGYALFVGAPVAAGFLSVAILRLFGPRSFAVCAVVGLAAGVVACAAFLILGMEGLICIAMVLPLGLPGVFTGAIIAYFLLHHRAWIRVRTAVGATLVLTAAALLSERSIKLRVPTFVVADSVEVDASRASVWRAVLSLGSLPEPTDWLLRSGVACPRSTVIEGAGTGAYRTCTLSTGKLREQIDAWDPGERLGWVGLETPPPMKEVNPFHEVAPPHLHGYYESVRGEFLIEDLGAGRSRLTRRTAYRHGLAPAFYWRLWCDFAASKVHRFVLEHTKRLAEEIEAKQRDPRPVARAL